MQPSAGEAQPARATTIEAQAPQATAAAARPLGYLKCDRGIHYIALQEGDFVIELDGAVQPANKADATLLVEKGAGRAVSAERSKMVVGPLWSGVFRVHLYPGNLIQLLSIENNSGGPGNAITHCPQDQVTSLMHFESRCANGQMFKANFTIRPL